MGPGITLRAGAMLAAGALLVHEGRYLAGYGHEADSALAEQGHGYVGWLLPLIVLALAAAAGSWIARVARGSRLLAGTTLGRTWAAAAGSLLAIYTLQESIEGALSPGHPGGLEAVLGHGGWAALPISLAVGAAIAFLVRGARAAERAALAATTPWRPTTFTAAPPRTNNLPATLAWVPRPHAGVLRLAGRAPPLAS